MTTIHDTKCPFDGADCVRKEIYFSELKNFAFRNPELVIPFKTNLFAICPLKNEIEREETCKRYREYCHKILRKEQQQNAR